jgi:hypothetical protein
MRFPDRPGTDASSDDIPRRSEGRDPARLAERLSRLPAGHPSGADGAPATADGDPAGGHPDERDPDEAVSHLPWPDDWVRHESPPEPGDAADGAGEPEPRADTGAQPEGGVPGTSRSSAEHSAATAAGPWASRGPYRPWFTVGDVPAPWFASEPDRPSSPPGPDG